MCQGGRGGNERSEHDRQRRSAHPPRASQQPDLSPFLEVVAPAPGLEPDYAGAGTRGGPRSPCPVARIGGRPRSGANQINGSALTRANLGRTAQPAASRWASSEPSTSTGRTRTSPSSSASITTQPAQRGIASNQCPTIPAS